MRITSFLYCILRNTSRTMETGTAKGFEIMRQRTYQPGDRVVYRRMKHKTHPSRRARGIHPALNGDDYSYYVEKFWVVLDVLENDRVLLRTPRGRQHIVSVDDPKLRYANWIERIRYRANFLRSEAKDHKSIS